VARFRVSVPYTSWRGWLSGGGGKKRKKNKKLTFANDNKKQEHAGPDQSSSLHNLEEERENEKLRLMLEGKEEHFLK